LSQFNLFVNKKPHKVKLPESRNTTTSFRVEVNGKPTEVELLEGIRFDKSFFIKVGGKPYRVELNNRETEGSINVKVDGVLFSARRENKNKAIVSQALKPALPSMEKKIVKTQALDKGAIVASMPGKVAILRVKPGDHVQAGNVLLILESMKMENEITSPTNGVVREVKVSEGAAVNIGEIMLIISET